MEINKVLEEAYIPETEWDFCYVDEKGLIYRPIYDRDTQEMLETGKEYFARYIYSKDNTKPSEPSKMEVRLGQIEDAVGILATQIARSTLLQGGK